MDQAMSRLLGSAAFLLVVVWIVSHVFQLGPIRDAAETTLAWVLWAGAASGILAALTLLAVGLYLGRTRPSWLRFVRLSRTVGALVGGVLVLIGLLHYRDTQPSGSLQWLVLGLAVLVAAGLVHGWILLTSRRMS
jgi:hypothetical protein